MFWVWLSKLWSNWQSVLVIIQPATMVRWHHQSFNLYWRWKSRRGKPGRPPIEREVRDLIRRMSRENPTWGAPRILSELLLLGHAVAEATVSKYMVRHRKAPSQTWRTFFHNPWGQTIPTTCKCRWLRDFCPMHGMDVGRPQSQRPRRRNDTEHTTGAFGRMAKRVTPSSQNIGTIPKLFGNAVLKTSPNANLGRHELLFDERSSREIGNPAACAHCDH